MPITREALQYLAQRFDDLYKNTSPDDRALPKWQKIQTCAFMFQALAKDDLPMNAVEKRMLEKYEPWIPDTFQTVMHWLKHAERARISEDEILATRLEKRVIEFMAQVSLPVYSQALEFTRVEVLMFDCQRFSRQVIQFLSAYHTFQSHESEPGMTSKVGQLLKLFESFFAELLPNEDLAVVDLIEPLRTQLMDIDTLLQLARKYQDHPSIRAALESSIIVCALSLEPTFLAIQQQRKQASKNKK